MKTSKAKERTMAVKIEIEIEAATHSAKMRLRALPGAGPNEVLAAAHLVAATLLRTVGNWRDLSSPYVAAGWDDWIAFVSIESSRPIGHVAGELLRRAWTKAAEELSFMVHAEERIDRDELERVMGVARLPTWEEARDRDERAKAERRAELFGNRSAPSAEPSRAERRAKITGRKS